MNPQNGPSRLQKEIAKITSVAFGVERPPIIRFRDDDSRSEVHVLEASNRSAVGFASFATIGLSEHPLTNQGTDTGFGVELLGGCRGEFVAFGNVLATLSFCVINSKWFCAPGMIFPDVVAIHSETSRLRDVYFAYPFAWGEQFASRTLHGRKVAWLQAIPVSRTETEFASRFGPADLEKRFQEQNVDLLNLDRDSVV
ncbi:MAG: suppressor of fused domain protein [Xanthomonadales bacterium]|nr:suppressor of fused domain protein [Xanthomonadales bacterium]